MATKFKKILALLLTLVMLVSLVSVNVFAGKGDGNHNDDNSNPHIDVNTSDRSWSSVSVVYSGVTYPASLVETTNWRVLRPLGDTKLSIDDISKVLVTDSNGDLYEFSSVQNDNCPDGSKGSVDITVGVGIQVNPTPIYKVSYNANGGSGTMEDTIASSDGSVTIAENGFTYDGHSFTGWNTASDASGTAYTASQAATLTENITLHAQWDEDEAEAPASTVLPVKVYVLDPSKTVPANGSDLGTGSYYPGWDGDGYISNISASISDSLLASLKGDNGEFDIGDTLLVSGNDGIDMTGLTDSVMSSIKTAFGLDATKTYTVTAYVIKVQSAHDYAGSVGNEWYGLIGESKADIHIDCYIALVPAAVTYHSNYPTDDTYVDSGKTTGDTYTVLGYAATGLTDRDDYNFLGWASTADATAAEYAAGDTFLLVGNTDLYAVWQQQTPPTPPVVTYYSLTTVYKTNGSEDNSSTEANLTSAPTDPGAGSTSTYNSNTYTYESFTDNGDNSYTVVYARSVYNVAYSWDGDIPSTAARPTNGNTYATEALAQADVDTTYTNETVIYTADGMYTFTGWTEDTEDDLAYTVTFTGTWAFTDASENVTGSTSLTVVKHDADGKALAGAAFTLTGGSYSQSGSTADSNGAYKNIVFTGLTEGTYTLTETSAPTGYEKAADVTISVDKNGTTTVSTPADTNTNVIQKVWNWIVSKVTGQDNTKPVLANNTITIVDEYAEYTVTYIVDGSTVNGPTTYKYGAAVAAAYNYAAPDGYTFSGWDKATPATMPAENVVISGTTSKNSYNWIINHYKIGTTAPALATADTGSALLGAKISLEDYVKDITGFTYNSKEADIIIATTGNTANIYYSPIDYTVTYEVTGDTAPDGFTIGTQTELGKTGMHLGDELTVAGAYTASSATGTWTFSGWTSADVTATGGNYTMPANNVTFTGYWTYASNAEGTLIINYFDAAGYNAEAHTGATLKGAVTTTAVGGTSYDVTETAPISIANYTFSEVKGSYTGSYVAGGATYIDLLYTRDTGTLVVTKSFSGIDSLPATFKLTVTGFDGSEKELTVANADSGTAYTWTVSGLPTGNYTVTESGADVTNYTLNTSGLNTLAVTNNGTVTADVVNTYTYVAPYVPTPDSFSLTVNWLAVDANGNVTSTLDTSSEVHNSGYAYDKSEAVSAKFSDYTYSSFTGNLTGTLTADTVINVYYVATVEIPDVTPPTTNPDEPVDTTEPVEPDEPVVPDEPVDGDVTIDDDNTPLAPAPDGDVSIEDGEVPMAPAPQTGDSILLYIVIMFAALALGGIVLIIKKETGRSHKH